jgi:hypothetical protein
MPDQASQAMLREVDLTTARNLSPLFDVAVRKEQPVVITRHGRERGLLMAWEQQRRLLSHFTLHVDVLPEDEVGGFTLWVRELKVGAHGATLLLARRELLDAVRSCVRHYLQEWDFYRHLPDMVAQEPYIHRLALATDDAELIDMLFSSDASSTSATPAREDPDRVSAESRIPRETTTEAALRP